MKKNVVLKCFCMVFLLIVFFSAFNVANAATLKFKDTIYRFHDASWTASNNILTTIMWMDKDVCYCLDYARAVSKKSSSYKVKNKSVSAKLQYVVMNGYPVKDLGLGNEDMNYAATQLAVWYFSDTNNGAKFSLNNLRANSGYSNYANKTISKAKELISAANKNGNSYTVPTPSMSIDSSSATKKVDGDYILIGPYKAKVKNGDSKSIKVEFSGTVPKSAKIVDKNGKAKSSFSNSEAVYVKISASETKGSAKLKFSASSKAYTASVYSTNEGPYTTGPTGKKVYYQDQLVIKPTTKSLSKSVSFSWEPTTGQIKLTKKGDDGKALAGVKFALYDSKNKLVATKTTNSEGIIVFSNLKPGTYYLVEKSTVSGYVLDSRKINVVVKSNKNSETTVTNKRISAALKIVKVDDLDGSPVKGAVFEILNSKNKVIQTIVTDSSGVATTGNLEYGKYYYREKSVPNGYILDTKKYSFEINSTKVIEKKVINKVKEGSITVRKLDGKDNKTPLKGAKFEVYDSEGKVIGTLTTNSKGEATIKNLKLGAYSIKEIKAPKGYKLDDRVYDLTLGLTNIDMVKTVYNFQEEVKVGSLKIVKVDEETNSPIEGVKFELYDSHNNLLDTLITDKDGIIFVEKLPVGNYYYKEVEAPGDYIVVDTLKSFSITETNLEYVTTIKNKKADKPKEEPEPVYGSLEVLKVGDISEEPLQGVKFELYNSDGDVIGTLITGADGKAKCSNLPVGSYTLKEVETVEGYTMTTEYVDFEITEGNLDVSLKVVNMKDRLVQTGDFFSTDMLIVLSVSVICTVVFFILKRGSLA